MILIDKHSEAARVAIAQEVDRLEALAADLRRVIAGTGPTADELASAPVLENWHIGEWRLPNLVGVGSGHPRLPDGRIYTTPVVLIDRSSGWIRSASRWYVIGDPLDPVDADEF